MTDLTLSQLQAACTEAGLSKFGNKAELVERLNAHAAQELSEASPEVAMSAEDGEGFESPEAESMATMQASARVLSPEDAAAKYAPPQAPRVLLTDEQHQATRPTYQLDATKRLIDDINTKYGQFMKAKLNIDHETIEFFGGPQGLYCTTVHQSPANILNRDGIKGAADQYARESREALFHSRTVQGGTGGLAGIN